MVLIFHGMLAFKVNGLDPHIFEAPRSARGFSLLLNEIVIFLSNGGAAVSFFFVHSGFVLGLSLDKEITKLTPARLAFAFLLKRLFRLFPVIFVAAFLGMLVANAINQVESPYTTAWVKGFFPQGEYTITDAFIKSITVDSELNKFAWSLRLEVIISVIFPLIYLAVRQLVTTILLMLVILATWNIQFNLLTGGMVHGYFSVYVACFSLGTLIGIIARKFKSRIFKAGIGQRNHDMHILLAFVALISVRPLAGHQYEKIAILIEALASMPIIFLIYYANHGRVYRFCNTRIVKFLGRISYSLYMVSSVSIYMAIACLAYLFEHVQHLGLMMNVLTTTIAAAISIMLATVCHYMIEDPCTNLGKKLAQRFIPNK